ncbi:exopolysaccharide biosynthesis protein [Consotaella aegiceratis]|uniref:exopolysaccharide biosynthesis protein n=1 Tax=Consotaella aegiceratis TaxID=3097961 RepID=UPI002F412681
MSAIPQTSTRRTKQRTQRRISAILRDLAARRDGEHMTVGDLSTAFDGRVFGAFFILFGGFNLIPLPPGASLISGLPLILISLQLALGRRRLWLPERIRRARVSRDLLYRFSTRIGPMLRRLERLARPRFWPAGDVLVASAIGWLALALAVLVSIPMPFTNMFPGVAIALLGMALTARDGIWLAAATIVAAGSILFLAVFYGAALLAVLAIV